MLETSDLRGPQLDGNALNQHLEDSQEPHFRRLEIEGTLGHFHRRLQPRFRKDEHEFLAAHAREEIGGPDPLIQERAKQRARAEARALFLRW